MKRRGGGRQLELPRGHERGLTLLFGHRGQDAVPTVSAAVFEPLLDVKPREATHILPLHFEDELSGNEPT